MATVFPSQIIAVETVPWQPPPPPPVAHSGRRSEMRVWLWDSGLISGGWGAGGGGGHQLLGSANAETTPAGAPAAAADRTQRPDATCEGKNG